MRSTTSVPTWSTANRDTAARTAPLLDEHHDDVTTRDHRWATPDGTTAAPASNESPSTVQDKRGVDAEHQVDGVVVVVVR